MKSMFVGVPIIPNITDLYYLVFTIGHALSEGNRLSFCSSCQDFLEEKEGSKLFQGIRVFFQSNLHPLS